MDILRNVAVTIFYLLFFSWLFIKIINLILINKLKCKEPYKEIKKNLKNQKIPKYLSKATRSIIIAILAVVAVYIMFAIILGSIALFMGFITLGGAAYVDTGADPSFYNYFMTSIGIYLRSFKYIINVLYINVYILLSSSIYINYLSYKELKRYNNHRL